MVNYAINVRGMKLDTAKTCVFTDIATQSSEMKWYIIKACQLWLMGVGTKKFMPEDIVTRAQFGTVLSRMLYGSLYEWWNPYYFNHLQALQKNWVITTVNPDLIEMRAYVMIMLQRSAK